MNQPNNSEQLKECPFCGPVTMGIIAGRVVVHPQNKCPLSNIDEWQSRTPQPQQHEWTAEELCNGLWQDDTSFANTPPIGKQAWQRLADYINAKVKEKV